MMCRFRWASLIYAAVALFGTWDAALRASGLDLAQIRRRAPWTREQIIDEIRRKARTGEPLNAKDVAPHSPRSREAAKLRNTLLWLLE